MPCAEVGCVETSNIDIRAASPTVTTATQTRIRPTCIVRPLQSVELGEIVKIHLEVKTHVYKISHY